MAQNFTGGSRVYRYRAPVRAAQQTSDVERGFHAGQQIDSILGQFADIGKAIRANQIANQLMTD